MHNEASLKDSQFQSHDLRKKQQMDRQMIRDAILQQKREDMLAIKRQREKNEHKKMEFQKKVMFDNKIKHQSISEQKMIAELRKKEFVENKIMKFRMDHEKKMAEEESVKHKKELEVLNMEKLEMELIRKLQHTQLLQKAAYEELETALAQPTDEYTKKYASGKSSPFATVDNSQNFKSARRDENYRASFDASAFKLEKLMSSDGLNKNPENNTSDKKFITELQKDESNQSKPAEESSKTDQTSKQ
jgi:hypothetical protein